MGVELIAKQLQLRCFRLRFGFHPLERLLTLSRFRLYGHLLLSLQEFKVFDSVVERGPGEKHKKRGE